MARAARRAAPSITTRATTAIGTTWEQAMTRSWTGRKEKIGFGAEWGNVAGLVPRPAAWEREKTAAELFFLSL